MSGDTIRFHMLPESWQPMGDGPYATAPLGEVTIDGLVVVCMECGSVVVPQMMDVHQRRHVAHP